MSLDAFGIAPADEQVHTVDRDDPTWNESWFFDWTTEDGTEAGHCRLGWMPGQGRVWGVAVPAARRQLVRARGDAGG